MDWEDIALEADIEERWGNRVLQWPLDLELREESEEYEERVCPERTSEVQAACKSE